MELAAGGGVEGLVGVLVADLPADDVGVVAEALCQCGGDAGRRTCGSAGWSRRTAGGCRVRGVAVGVGAEGVGIFGGEPCGRSVGGGADDDGDVMFFREADGAGQPVEVVVVLGGLQRAPGELADAQ